MTARQDHELHIRRAIPDDAPNMQRCAEAAYQHYTVRIGKPPAPMLADYSAVAKGANTFVAEIHGEMVGLLVLVASDDGIMLDNIAVFPEHQGQGIGRKLIEFAEGEARKQKFPHIDLYTNETMTKNLAIYKHCGYVEVDRRSQGGYRRVYMRKNLDTLNANQAVQRTARDAVADLGIRLNKGIIMSVIQHVAFNCINKIKMEQFYTKHFGFRRARVFNAGSENEFVMLRLENMCIELFRSTGDRPASNSKNDVGFRHIAFEVLDLDNMVACLIADGVKVGEIIDYSDSVAGLRICFFDDPEGNKVEIMQGWSDDETLTA